MQAQAQQGANLSGIYWCDPQPSPCPWPGQAMSITQSGISLSSDKASYVGDSLPWDVMRTIISERSSAISTCAGISVAGDYAEAMWLALQADAGDDYVIGAGQSYSIRDFCEMAFAHVGKDWRAHVEVDPALLRPIDSLVTVAQPAKAAQVLGWRPRTPFKTLVATLVDARVAALSQRTGRASHQPLG